MTGARQEFHDVRVSAVIEETPDACSLVLDVPPELSDRFAYRPGQFLTVEIPGSDSGSVARCYSLASSPRHSDHLKITVKRVAEGYGSNWLCDNAEPGTTLRTLPPSGSFTPKSLDADFLMLAGGSGITPIMSIIRAALAEGRGRVVLLYANRDERSVIFADELRELGTTYPDRLLVLHWLDSVQGVPTLPQLVHFIRPFTSHEAFVCGPEPFMDAATQALRDLGVPRNRVHVERFVSLSDNPFEQEDADAATGAPEEPPTQTEPASVEVDLDGEHHAFSWPRGTKLLDLLLENGLDAPYSCREGSCSACACRLVKGEVRLLRNQVLDKQDLDDGYILACQALPVTDTLSVTYDE